MKSIISFLFLAQTIINVANFALAHPLYEPVYKCRNTGNFQPNSPYQTNLMSALNTLPDDAANQDGWAIGFAGNKAGEEVQMVALCWGYVKSADCKKCIADGIPLLRKNCPNQRQAVAWMVRCMIRYGDNSFLKDLDTWFWVHITSDKKASNPFFSDKTLDKLLIKLTAEAAAGSQFKKFSQGDDKFPGQDTVYMAAQCTPDLSTDLCNQCFLHMFKEMKPCCSGKLAAAMLSPNCFLRYSISYDFRTKTS